MKKVALTISLCSALFFAGCSEETNIDTNLLPYTVEEAKNNEKVVVEDFSDVQCGHCKSLNPIMNQLKKDLSEVEIRGYQYPFVGPQSYPSAIAIECVAIQDNEKRSEFASKVFAANSLSSSIRKGFAEEMNLNMDAYKECTDSNNSEAIVKASLAEGETRGVTGTPAIFINGEVYEGPRSYDSMYAAIQEAMKN